MATLEDVRKSFKDERTAIAELDRALAAERKKIKVTAFRANRRLSKAEVTRRKEIAATRTELGEALQVLALNTIDGLEIAEDVDDLLRELEFINRELKDDLAKLKKIESYAENVAKFASGLAKLVERVTALRPSLL